MADKTGSTWTWRSTIAECRNCGKKWAAQNAMACAAGHNRTTGHTVDVTAMSTYQGLAVDPNQSTIFEEA